MDCGSRYFEPLVRSLRRFSLSILLKSSRNDVTIRDYIWMKNCGKFFMHTGNVWIKYFHLIWHLILTKINCITLKIRSKADFKSNSQNIWQQIILLFRTVMQRICTWPKIWTLSGRLSLMRNVQLMKKKYTYIFRVYSPFDQPKTGLKN